MKKRFLFLGLILIPYFGIILAEENNKDRWIKNNSGTHYSYEQSEFTTFQYNGTEGTLNSYTLDPGNAPDGYSYVAEKTVASAGSLNVNSGTNETTGSGGVKKLKLNGAASATAFIAANTSPVSFTISMNGELSKNGDGNGTVTWSALANSKFFWLEPVEKIVAEGTSVTIEAKGTPTESTWNVNNKTWKDWTGPNIQPYKTSSITLNRNMWDKMKWTPSSPSQDWQCPPVGIYYVSATTTETSPDTPRTASATVYVANLGNVKFKRNGWRSYRELDADYKMIACFLGKTCSFSIDIFPTTLPEVKKNIVWDGPITGNTVEVIGVISSSGFQNASFIGITKTAKIITEPIPTGDSDVEYAAKHPIDSATAVYYGVLSGDEPSRWANETYPGSQLNTIADAARHAYWNCLLARYVSNTYATGVATGHEVGSTIETETIMDLHNNAIGRSLANQHTHGNDNTCCRNAVKAAVSSGLLWYLDMCHGYSDNDGIAFLQPTNKF